MKKSRKDNQFVKAAYFKGGSKALEAFILNHLQYPVAAFEKGIEGTIHAKYDINNRGKVVKINLYNSIGFGCDEEARRVINLLEFEVPKTRGLRLTFHKEIHIHFKMPITQPVDNQLDNSINNPPITGAEQDVNLQYEIITKPNEPTDSTGENYNYTILV